MKKIPSLFKRDYEGTRLVFNEVVPGSEWVINGEGVATRKYDGCCCMIKDGILFKRRTIKKITPTPKDFILEEHDIITDKLTGWVKVSEMDQQDKYFREAFNNLENKENGTYELLGKGSQGDIEKFGTPTLLKHSKATVLEDCPRDFEGIKNYLKNKDIEGIVWHHQDGRMAKIKKRDFGLSR